MSTFFLGALLIGVVSTKAYARRVLKQASVFQTLRVSPQRFVLSHKEGGKGSSRAVMVNGQKAVQWLQSNDKGYLMLTSKDIPVVGRRKMKVSLFFRTNTTRYGASLSLMVRQLTKSKKPVGRMVTTPVSIRQILASANGEWSPRYLTLRTHRKARFFRVFVVLRGGPISLTMKEVRVEQARREGRRRVTFLSELPRSKKPLVGFIKKRKQAEAWIKKGAAPKLIINNHEEPPVWYQRSFWLANQSLHRLFAKQQVKVHVIPIQLGPYQIRKKRLQSTYWKGHRAYLPKEVDRSIRRALAVNPDLYLILSLSVSPYRGWGRRYPSEVAQNERGQRAVCKYSHHVAFRNKLRGDKEYFCPSLYSTVFQNEAKAAVIQLIKDLKKKPYYRAVVGFFLAGGDDGQWSPWARSGAHQLSDYSPAAQSGFRRWMKKRYKNIRSFQSSARSKKIRSFGAMQIPSVAQRLGRRKVLFSPSRDRLVIDAETYLCEERFRTLLSVAKAVKVHAGKRVVVGSYFQDMVYGRNHANACSHVRLRSPYLDYFVAPLDYGLTRRPGWIGGLSVAHSSMKLHNKLFLQELDFRTKVSTYVNDEYDHFVIGRLNDARSFHAVNRRETALMKILGMGQWYYSLAGGSFHAKYAKVGIKESVRLFHQEQSHSTSLVRPQVAVIVDGDSAMFVPRSKFAVNVSPSTRGMRSALWLSGVPFSVYDIRDLARIPVSQYKVFVFANSTMLQRWQRQWIRKHLKRNGRVLVWMHSTGYINSAGASLRHMRSLTGQRIRVVKTFRPLSVNMSNIQKGVWRGMNARQGVVGYVPSGWEFFVSDPKSLVLGRYSKGNRPAITLKKMSGWTSLFIGAPGGLGPDLLHRIASYAGARTLGSAGNLLATNGRLFLLHGVRGGKVTVRLPFRCDVHDAFTNARFASKARTLTLRLTPKQTIVLRLFRR
tara:strand:+ start:6346 stop:9162 length:2817 start_codon:yes stop_codon:yes gene_type:complete